MPIPRTVSPASLWHNDYGAASQQHESNHITT